MSDFLNQVLGLESDNKQAVLQHVLSLLNTRRGSLAHMPDYGLPEYNTSLGCRHAKKQFMDALKSLLAKYEPRLQILEVLEVQPQHAYCVFQMKLSARLVNVDSVSFDALLLSGGSMVVLE